MLMLAIKIGTEWGQTSEAVPGHRRVAGFYSGVGKQQPAGPITRRSLVQFQPPQPTSMNLTLLVIAKDQTDLNGFDETNVTYRRPTGTVSLALQRAETPGITWATLSSSVRLFRYINASGYPLSTVANHYVDLKWTGPHIFGLVHADMTFGPGSIEAFSDAAESCAIVGACGRALDPWPEPPAGINPGYHWSKWNPGVVSTLDSSCVFFRTDLGLRFDGQTFDGFHLHVEDLCIQASQKGYPVLVPKADAVHSSPDKNGSTWYTDRDRYLRRLITKWPGVRFCTT